MAASKPRVFSGIQPTGQIHLGNYLGAIKNWVDSQDRYQNIFCLVDLHAITVRQDPATLRAQIREAAGILLAAGIDPARSVLFRQSHIPAHSELAWLLNCIASMGPLERMTQFKEKSEKLREQTTVGIFTYPLLMAADILLYRTDKVPVGADQKQHIELARDLAQRFNATYGETFVVPEPLIPPVGARIMGLDDPTKKMSKSLEQPGHAVGVLDPPAVITKKIRSAKTDSGTEVRFDEERPGLHNLLTIYQVLSGLDRAAIEQRFAGKGYGQLKGEVADLVVECLRPLQERYQRLAADPGHLEQILRQGAEKILPLAQATLKQALEHMGLD
jgi:tryptophanyl-tRNA synthetase